MQNPENIQPEERLEGAESTERIEEQAMQDAAHEPGARIEETQDFEQAEAIENELKEAMETGGQGHSLPGSEVSATPINLPDKADAATGGEGGRPGSDVSATPINLPDKADAAVGSEGGHPGSEVSATPINLPYVANETEGGEGGRPGGDVAATPINLPDKADVARVGVEQTQGYEQSEGVEGALTEAMSNMEATVAARPEVAGTPEAPESQAQDPLTGKGYGEQSQSPGDDTGEEEPQMAKPYGESLDTSTRADAVSDFQPVGQDLSDKDIDTGHIDGNEPVYEMDDQTSGNGQDLGKGDAPLSEKVGGISPQRLGPENMPQEKQVPYGVGKNGMLFPDGGKGLPGSGKGMPGGGSGTSGGSLPVGGRGGGSVGKGGGHTEKSDLGRWLTMKSMENETPGYVPEPDGNGYWVQDKNGDWHYQEVDHEEAPAEKPPQGDPIDGDQPMPYTGGAPAAGGGNPDPDEPVGGLDSDSGKVFPVYGKGTGGKKGGRTPGDKDGDDDSGHFLGDPNLSGDVDTASPDPGDLDYNEANTLEDDAKGAIRR